MKIYKSERTEYKLVKKRDVYELLYRDVSAIMPWNYQQRFTTTQQFFASLEKGREEIQRLIMNDNQCAKPIVEWI